MPRPSTSPGATRTLCCPVSLYFAQAVWCASCALVSYSVCSSTSQSPFPSLLALPRSFHLILKDFWTFYIILRCFVLFCFFLMLVCLLSTLKCDLHKDSFGYYIVIAKITNKNLRGCRSPYLHSCANIQALLRCYLSCVKFGVFCCFWFWLFCSLFLVTGSHYVPV